MYNIFYIYTYKYTKPPNAHALTLSLHKRPYKPRPHKQPNELHQQEQAASHVYRAKCTSRIMHQAIQLAAYIYTAIFKNCIMRFVFQFCLCL